MRLALFFILLVSFSKSLAIPIYKDPDSTFSSGDALVDSASSPEDASLTRTWYKLKNDEWVKRSDVLLPIDFSLSAAVKDNTVLHSAPRSTSLPVGTLKKNQKVSILKHQDIWVKVKSPELNGWIHQNLLASINNEFGYIFLKNKSALKTLATKNAKIITTLNSGEKLKAVDVQGQWVKVVTENNKQGWLSIYECVTKLDLASEILIPNQNAKPHWEKINSLNGTWIETGSLHFINARKALGLKMKTNGLLLKKKTYVTQEIAKIETVRWNQYYSDKTGLVWYPDKILFDNNSPQEVVVSNSEIFKTDIFDIATHPLLSDFKIVSKNGIYKTTDGKLWNKLIFFNSDNHPVAITRSGTVFIGPYVSHDAGETFKPYLRFDRLLRAYANYNQPLPQQFNLTKVEYDEMRAKLKLQFNGNTTLESSDSGKHWSFASNESRKLRSALSRSFLIRIDRPSLNQKSPQLAKSAHRRLATVFSY